MSPNPNINYVREVTASFIARCPTAATLTPDDFAVIAEWEKQEIPLGVILKSIGEACEEHDKDTRSIREIHDKVKRDFVNWLQTRDTQSGI